jgi:hypothetical protein
MPCAVLGTGLVGCYLGAAARAPSVVRGPSGRLAATRVRLPAGERAWQPGGADASLPLLVTTRCDQTPWTELPTDSLVVQNGLGQPRPVVVPFMALDVVDGVLAAIGPRPRLVCGPVAPCWLPVIAAWREAGLEVQQVPDARPAQWEKAIYNATVGPLCRATGRSMAAVWSDPELRALVLAATAEGERAARNAGVVIPGGIAERAAAFFAAVGAHEPSCRRDPGELPWILGPLLAASPGPAPALERIAALAAAQVSRAM